MADPDLCIKSEIRPCDGLKYTPYFLLSVSYALCIHHDTESLFWWLDHYYKLKQGLLGNPTVYLRAKLKKTQLENGVCACAFSGVQYVYEAISIVCRIWRKKVGVIWLLLQRLRILLHMVTSLSLMYVRNLTWLGFILSISDWWMSKLGKIDIDTEIFSWGKGRALRCSIGCVCIPLAEVFITTYPNIDMSGFKKCD